MQSSSPDQSAMTTSLKCIDDSLFELSEAISKTNQFESREASIALVTETRQLISMHMEQIGTRIREDLLSVRSLFERHLAPREEQDLGITQSLREVRNAQGWLLADVHKAIRLSNEMIFPPLMSSDLDAKVEVDRSAIRHSNLNGIEKSLIEARVLLKDRFEPEHADAKSLQQKALVSYYIKFMRAEISIALAEVRLIGPLDLSVLSRCVEAISEATADMISTVAGLKDKVTDALRHAAHAIKAPIRHAAQRLFVLVKRAQQRTKFAAAAPIVDKAEAPDQREHTQYLLRELTHRSQNLLAITQAMARQSAKTNITTEEYIHRFTSRLAGLADSHRILSSTDWTRRKLT